MSDEEKLFRLQIFQYGLSTLYMYPIRLYKNNCYEEFHKIISKNSKIIDKVNALLPADDLITDSKQLISRVKELLRSNPNKYNRVLFEIFDEYGEELRKILWETKVSNSLMLTRELKANKMLWVLLMLHDLQRADYIDNNFKKPHVEDCLVQMKTVCLKLDDDCTIVVGRLFTEGQNIDDIVLDIIKNYEINSVDIFELTKLAHKRNPYNIDDVKIDIKSIKEAFILFMNIIEKLPSDISKDSLEKISVYIYMIVRGEGKDFKLYLEDIIISFKDDILRVDSSVNSNFLSRNLDAFTCKYKEYRQYRSFLQNEFTSRLKSSLAKKYSGFDENYDYLPIQEILNRICSTLNADGGCYIKYRLSKQTFKRAADYGKSEYTSGITKHINKINKGDKNTIKKSRVIKIVRNFYNSLHHEAMDKLILFNIKEDELLQPLENRKILSNIAMPVTFKHKLLGIILIDSFRKNAFTKNDIQLILSITNALSIQIYDGIMEKNLLSIIENIPNQIELEDEKEIDSKLKNLTKYINGIFFSICVDVWIYDKEKFRWSSSSIINIDKKGLSIGKNEPELICELLREDCDKVACYDIKNSDKFVAYKPKDDDNRINTVEIHAIRQNGDLVGAFSVYNQKKEDYLCIDSKSLQSVKSYLKIFLSVIDTFKRQRELVHSHALHDINQNLMMIDNKCKQLKTLLHKNFRDIDNYSRYRFDIKLKDIDRFRENTKFSFNFITGKGKKFFNRDEVDLQIDEQFGNEQKKFKSETNLLDVINCITNSIEYRHKNLRFDYKLPDAMVKISPILLEDIFQNLIQNAVKYSYQNRTICISGKILKFTLALRVESIGIKIDDDEIDDIFEKGYRGFFATEFEEKIGEKKISYPTKESENAGFGLYKCNKLVKLFAGTIELEKSCETNEGYKNIFLLTIPTNLVNQQQILKKLGDNFKSKYEGKR